MEIKTIFYVLLAIGWLVSKVLSAQRKASPPVPENIPNPVPVGGKPENHRSVARGRSTVFTAQGKRKSPMANPLSKPNIIEETFMEGGGITPDNDDSIPGMPAVNAPADQNLSDEIRAGRIDWRRQVVISELLTKKYI